MGQAAQDISLNDTARLEDFLQAHRLPPSYLDSVDRWFRPLAAELALLHTQAARPLVIGINGSQGSGKSTLAALLTRLLQTEHGLRAADLSIDDFYKTRKQRQALASQVHPLLATRGVPGTHDTELLMHTLDQLQHTQGTIAVPRFDKAGDDRHLPASWTRFKAPLDIIILEGWCLGVTPQVEGQLKRPVNTLEASEDSDGTWRSFVNSQIRDHYLQVWEQIDAWIMLQAPSFDCVYQWRSEQEQKLADALAAAGSDKRAMDAAQLERFIHHYQRLTEHTLRDLPERVHYLFRLNAKRGIAVARHTRPVIDA